MIVTMYTLWETIIIIGMCISLTSHAAFTYSCMVANWYMMFVSLASYGVLMGMSSIAGYKIERNDYLHREEFADRANMVHG
jgi:hypothetical protein